MANHQNQLMDEKKTSSIKRVYGWYAASIGATLVVTLFRFVIVFHHSVWVQYDVFFTTIDYYFANCCLVLASRTDLIVQWKS